MTITKLLRLSLLGAIAAIASAGAMAQSNIAVSATVLGKCSLGTMPSLDFGSLDPTTAPQVTPPAVNVTYNCTKGVTPTTFTIGGVATTGAVNTFNGNLANGGNNIPFSLTWSNTSVVAGGGFGSGTAVSVPVSGKIVAGAYSNAPAGVYNASVGVTVAP